MINTILNMIFIPLLVLLILILVWYIIENTRKKRLVISLSKLSTNDVINLQKDNDEFNFKLIQAGITFKEFNEARYLFITIGLLFLIIIPFIETLFFQTLIVIVTLLFCYFGGKIYLYIAKKERVEKINSDLGVFLDLIIIILEAGGGLKNAFFEVSKKADGIICKDLLKEISILEYEMSNYSNKIAYDNLKKRIDSKEVDKVIDYLMLNEETGVGVRNIFELQSNEIRKDKFYKIKGKVNTLNMYLMLIIFLFVLPAIGAFVAFPIMSGRVSMGL